MTAPNRAVFGCCGTPALPPFQHKCNKGGARPGAGNTETPPARSGVGPRHPLSRAGKLAEDALCAALVAAGYEVVTYAVWLARALEGGISPVFVREFPAGIMLSPPRRFRVDLLHPLSKTVIEVEGGAHGIQRQRKGDILREQLLAAAGLRVVRVLPEQAIDGSAVELVSRAIGAKECK